MAVSTYRYKQVLFPYHNRSTSSSEHQRKSVDKPGPGTRSTSNWRHPSLSPACYPPTASFLLVLLQLLACLLGRRSLWKLIEIPLFISFWFIGSALILSFFFKSSLSFLFFFFFSFLSWLFIPHFFFFFSFPAFPSFPLKKRKKGMESEIRNRKTTTVESVVDNGVSTANRHHASATASNSDSNGTRDSSEDLSLNHSLSDSQKQSLAKEQEEAAFGKTPNGTSTSPFILLFACCLLLLAPLCVLVQLDNDSTSMHEACPSFTQGQDFFCLVSGSRFLYGYQGLTRAAIKKSNLTGRLSHSPPSFSHSPHPPFTFSVSPSLHSNELLQ